MTTNDHGIDLTSLTRMQLKTLQSDISTELQNRDHDDRIALEEKLRTIVEEAGFNADDLRFSNGKKRRGRKPKHHEAPA